ncbi:DNA polymerase III subunit epsilon [Limibacillus halophilus]|uniref:DNA polymerase III subunit epsilon n=1 Tax=Limibacillus halophilus TaxID=1579333 RepID=A0A839SNL7_9PROT|nr:DNA polymerase III subunit epsilon [Limibacillus halophilus]MBB3064042.1 DNA polymerase-3 subunit epsilon [Limibacillus halophilus]
MREIVLDTETTGFDPTEGHRIVEIACLELVNHVQTGRHWRRFINPERDMPAEAFAVHGLSEEFLRQHPKFAEVAQEFLDFIEDDKLVIHNAEFDMRFINAELALLERPPLPSTQAIDTLQIARKRFPGAPANLDALCRRFGIDNSHRTHHGALLDCQLLAEVYLELRGGQQQGLALASVSTVSSEVQNAEERRFREPRHHAATQAERDAHAQMLEKLKDPLWAKK